MIEYFPFPLPGFNAKMVRMDESWRSRLLRRLCNHVPAFRATGARITYLADDGSEMHIELPRRLRNLNVRGEIYGGSMYSAVGGLGGAMLIRLLGPGYFVALKASTVRFLKPGRGTLRAQVRVPPGELESIREALTTQAFIERVFPIELVDARGAVCCAVENTVHIALKRQGMRPCGKPGPSQGPGV